MRGSFTPHRAVVNRRKRKTLNDATERRSFSLPEQPLSGCSGNENVSSGAVLPFEGAAAFFEAEEALADADRLGGHLDQLVGGDPLDRRLQGVDPWGGQLDALVVAVGPDVGLLLGAHSVDHHLVVTGALADDHALVDLLPGTDEQLAAQLQVV